MPMSPPLCRTCGVAEWRHVCIGAPKVREKAPKPEKPKRPSPRKKAKP